MTSRRAWNREGITTMTAAILVVLIVGGSMLFFNEYERSTLKQSATTSTTDIIVGDYKYNFSVPEKITGFDINQYRNSEVYLYGDRIGYISYSAGVTNPNYFVRGYNITTDTHYILYTIYQEADGWLFNGGIGERAQTWGWREYGTNYQYGQAYIWSNGTIWTSQEYSHPQLSGYQANAVTMGKYIAYSVSNVSDDWVYWTHINLFDMETWTETTIRNVTGIAMVYRGGADNELIYTVGTSIKSWFALNVETGSTYPLYVTGSTWTHPDIGDGTVAFADENTHEIKMVDYVSGYSESIEDINTADAYNTVGCYGDTFVASNTYTGGSIYMRFYDKQTDNLFEIAEIQSITPVYTMVSSDLSNQYCVFYDGGSTLVNTYYYSYLRTPTKNTTADTTDNGTATTAPQTSLEQAQSWLSSNWIYIAAVIGIVAGISVFAYRRYRSQPKYREEGAKMKINWGLIVSIALIVAIAVVLLLV